jgi:hypothetical protein
MVTLDYFIMAATLNFLENRIDLRAIIIIIINDDDDGDDDCSLLN